MALKLFIYFLKIHCEKENSSLVSVGFQHEFLMFCYWGMQFWLCRYSVSTKLLIMYLYFVFLKWINTSISNWCSQNNVLVTCNTDTCQSFTSVWSQLFSDEITEVCSSPVVHSYHWISLYDIDVVLVTAHSIEVSWFKV